MHVKEGLVLRKVGEQYIVAPTGKASEEFNGMVRLNAVGAFLFEQLQADTSIEELVKRVTEKYDVSEERAAEDTKVFLNILKDANLLSEDGRQKEVM